MAWLPALSRGFLELVVTVAEPVTYTATLVAAVSGLLYMLANRPLQRAMNDERVADRLEISRLSTRGKELDLQVAEQQEQAAAQQERAAKAEREILELKERLKPRHLSNDERDRLLARLRLGPKGPVEIVCPVTDAEACDFAHELRQVLDAAGFAPVSMGMMSIVGIPTGVRLRQRDLGAAIPHLQALYETLRAFSVDTTFEAEVVLPAAPHVRMLVGLKPSPLRTP